MVRRVDTPPEGPRIAAVMEQVAENAPYEDPMDDVFGDDANDVNDISTANTSNENDQFIHTAHGEALDVARLRRIHVTTGYREGLSESKGKFIQEGFDEGYSLGAVIGSKAGWCLGVLESICRAAGLNNANDDAVTEASSSNKTGTGLQASLSQARKDLSLQSLFGQQYFGADGIWTYDVPTADDEDNVTFQDVSNAHPLISIWSQFVKELAVQLSLDLETQREVVRVEGSPEGD
ncbi:hypothetical protein MBLNU457_g2552t1 [Dothideomycetes sp. NU457]